MGYLEKVSYVIEGEKWVSIDQIAEKVGIDAEELAHVYKKYGDMYFAIDYIRRNKMRGRDQIQRYDGKYTLDGELFDSLIDVANYLGVSEYALKKCLSGCSSWSTVRVKLKKCRIRRSFSIDGVNYDTLKDVADTLSVSRSRLAKWHGFYGDINKALNKIRTLDRLKEMKRIGARTV